MGEAMVDMLVLICATCCDSFFMSVAYGAERIKIPWKATMIISLCGTMLLGLSIALAKKLYTAFIGSGGEMDQLFHLDCIGLDSLVSGSGKALCQKA